MRASHRQQYVYVLYSPALRRYKIGRTVNPKQRFRTISLFEQPTVCGVFPCGDSVTVERWLHERFNHFRVHGEWFDLSAAKVSELMSCCRSLATGSEQ